MWKVLKQIGIQSEVIPFPQPAFFLFPPAMERNWLWKSLILSDPVRMWNSFPSLFKQGKNSDFLGPGMEHIIPPSSFVRENRTCIGLLEDYTAWISFVWLHSSPLCEQGFTGNSTVFWILGVFAYMHVYLCLEVMDEFWWSLYLGINYNGVTQDLFFLAENIIICMLISSRIWDSGLGVRHLLCMQTVPGLILSTSGSRWKK